LTSTPVTLSKPNQVGGLKKQKKKFLGVKVWTGRGPEGVRPKYAIGHLGPCQGHIWGVSLSLFLQELTAGLGPKKIGYSFQTSLSQDAKCYKWRQSSLYSLQGCIIHQVWWNDAFYTPLIINLSFSTASKTSLTDPSWNLNVRSLYPHCNLKLCEHQIYIKTNKYLLSQWSNLSRANLYLWNQRILPNTNKISLQ